MRVTVCRCAFEHEMLAEQVPERVGLGFLERRRCLFSDTNLLCIPRYPPPQQQQQQKVHWEMSSTLEKLSSSYMHIHSTILAEKVRKRREKM